MAAFLLRRYQWSDKRVTVTPHLLKAAASNPVAAPEMLRLPNQYDDHSVLSVITVGVLSRATRNRGGPAEAAEALRMLLMELDSRLTNDEICRISLALNSRDYSFDGSMVGTLFLRSRELRTTWGSQTSK